MRQKTEFQDTLTISVQLRNALLLLAQKLLAVFILFNFTTALLYITTPLHYHNLIQIE